jgi:hypothetical protein
MPMGMESMLDWKILAAVFAVLIVMASALATNSGVKDLFMNTTTGLGDSTSGSPFDWFTSLFSTPGKSAKPVSIMLMVDNITLSVDSPTNITSGGSGITNFKGTVSFDLKGNKTVFSPSGSEISIDLELESTAISGVRIPAMTIAGIDFIVTSESTNITGTDDDIEIHDFVGEVSVTDRVLLTGNVSRVKDGHWSIG